MKELGQILCFLLRKTRKSLTFVYDLTDKSYIIYWQRMLNEKY